MKFYYNGKLVRTSKTHEYKYAVANADGSKILSCHGTYKAAQNEIDRKIAEHRQTILNLNNAKKALESGKKYYFVKYGRREYKYEFREEDTIDHYTEAIKKHEETIEWLLNNRKIVELQAE